MTQFCPRCRSERLHHSRLRSGLERLRWRLTGRVPFRCHECNWRGWRRDVGRLTPKTLRPIHRDLTEHELEGLDP